MRNVFWDTNVLLDLLDCERDGHETANNLLELARKRGCECQCSWHSLSIIDYVGGKKFGREDIWELLRSIVSEFVIPKTGTYEARFAFHFLDGDFVDAMQIAAAVAGNADLLITDSKSGFGKSPIKVVSPHAACGLI